MRGSISVLTLSMSIYPFTRLASASVIDEPSVITTLEHFGDLVQVVEVVVEHTINLALANLLV